MSQSIISRGSVQSPSSGEGGSLYNLTGNAPNQPMSTRDQELQKRRKRLIELARQCVSIHSMKTLIHVAVSL